ncbi:cyclin-like protein [Wolfiporia cocos MD-104 SS10]|uniref:Cyclin-like protein n=1 Tax=Wolfiporia cocos (strain MD-104) TaxID=742152 RepID=A0A2H3JN54_WOLCO|nr:cyclin-like protein [Wolfiporia cocos MD-104 SS10]
MDAHDSAGSPSQSASTSHIKFHLPYFTTTETEQLSDKQRGKLSVTQEEKARQQACGFVEAVGARIGFPRKTIATAQNLYHRFHLFFPRKDFSYHDVCLASLYVSSKMHDTLKKPREIIMISYMVRFPELAAKSKSIAGEIDMDPATVEHDRQRLLAVERLILELVCFNFTSRLPFSYVIKLGRALGASKSLTKLAWRLTVDSYRTLVNLQYPPHVVALGCIYLAALLSSFEQSVTEPIETKSAHQIAEMLRKPGWWESRYQAVVEDLEEIAHAVMDLLITASQNPQATASPATPSSPSPHLGRSSHSQTGVHPQLPPVPYKTDQLIRLKIVMRETDRPPRQRESMLPRDAENEPPVLGRNEGTVRFLFGPPNISGA